MCITAGTGECLVRLDEKRARSDEVIAGRGGRVSTFIYIQSAQHPALAIYSVLKAKESEDFFFFYKSNFF